MSAVIELIVLVIRKLIDLITYYRKATEEGSVSGVGDTLQRAIEIIKRQDSRTDLAGKSPEEANAIKRRDALIALQLAGINLKEGDLRRLIEDALLVYRLTEQQ